MTAVDAASGLSEQTVKVWGGRLAVRVKVGGSGAPLVYLHHAAGMRWDPFISHLAQRHTVYAPQFPGSSRDDPYAIHVIDELADLVLAYEEVIGGLGLHQPVLVGHSFGGMLAAELAAHFPALPTKLVLISPLGLWRQDAPLGNWMTTPPGDLFHDPTTETARALLVPPADPQAAQAAAVSTVWAAGCAAKFAWPIADRGLENRLHRIAAPTLILWGRHDRVVPAAYATDFAQHVPHATVSVINSSAHFPQVEQLQQAGGLVDAFLAGQPTGPPPSGNGPTRPATDIPQRRTSAVAES
jgi:pimeloyl-ACP methyl ester carboxylesterase